MNKDIRILVLFLIGMLVVFTIGEGITGEFFLWKPKSAVLLTKTSKINDEIDRNYGSCSEQGYIKLSDNQCTDGCSNNERILRAVEDICESVKEGYNIEEGLKRGLFACCMSRCGGACSRHTCPECYEKIKQ